MSFSLYSLTLLALLAGTIEGVIELLEPELPGSVVIRGEGEIVDPDRWTEFPTPPPVITHAPTPYPTPLSPAPTPINYVLLDNGDAGNCVSGTTEVALDDCLDAATLVGDKPGYIFPFYVEEVDSSTNTPCGCYLKGLNGGAQRIIEYNKCLEYEVMAFKGYGVCDDNVVDGNHLPSYYGSTSDWETCRDICEAIPDCIAYDFNYNCDIRFASVNIRDSNTAPSGFTGTNDGCGNSCDTSYIRGNTDGAVTLYEHDNFQGYEVTFPTGNFNSAAMNARGAPGSTCSSLKVGKGYRVHLFDFDDFSSGDWHFVLGPGDYTLSTLQTYGFQNDDLSAMRVYVYNTATSPTPQCRAKETLTPPGSANSITELVCALESGIDAGVDTLEQWDKVYGAGNEGYGYNTSLWAIDTLPLKDFYIRRICTYCTESHKDIIYKRLTDIPDGFNIQDLFLGTWRSTNNVLNTDFKLYSSMSYALADIMPWSACNYNDDGIGFPRDCGPSGTVGGQWNSLYRGGQSTYAYYLWHGNPEASITDRAQCTGSEPGVCGCSSVNQRDYRGTVAVTRTGITCQKWSVQSPHGHDSYDFGDDNGLGDHNYCRNPTGGDGVWCLTTDPEVAWDYCAVPMCTDGLGYDHDWYKQYPYEDDSVFTLDDILVTGGVPAAVDVYVQDAELWGKGDFRIEMDVAGHGGSTVGVGGKNYGVLFARSSNANAPFDGPAAFIYDDGTFVYRVRSDEIFTCSLPNPTDTNDRHIEVSRIGNAMFATIDGTTCTGEITLQPDYDFVTDAPLRIGGSHLNITDENLDMDIKNIKIHGVPNPTAAPTPNPTAAPITALDKVGTDYISQSGTGGTADIAMYFNLADYLAYGPVTFSGYGASVKIVYSKNDSSCYNTPAGLVELRLGSTTGTLIGSFAPSCSGSWSTF
eukprot:CAMPEP_0178918002 /NCGR_PEP_ID=MMETSP0786-20121207/13579_1 /TAXON_ID=186022 /ORGANISM="Thalassionema frauenfeldii, Strain CCMP 1798" /LENGTH=916 /DNA_ID=CAMNT_0020591653 /DNA_START=188 /DNA_END=2935 /DNA_ORIENTATION=+